MYQDRKKIRQIMIAVNVIDGIYDSIAKKIGIKENLLTLLYALDDGKIHSQKEICDEWFIPKTTINTIVKECVKKGYVLLNTNSGRKEKEIYLTERGSEYAKMVLGQVHELEEHAMERTLERVSPEFIQGLEAFVSELKNEEERFCDGTEKNVRRNLTD